MVGWWAGLLGLTSLVYLWEVGFKWETWLGRGIGQGLHVYLSSSLSRRPGSMGMKSLMGLPKTH